MATPNTGVNLPLKKVEGMKGRVTTARAVYDALELDPNNYSRWFYKHITNNPYFQENTDYIIFLSQEENSKRGRKAKNAYLTEEFAIKLAMKANGEIGEKIRDYFYKSDKVRKEMQKAVSGPVGEETAKFFNNLLNDVSKYSPTARTTLAAKISQQVFGIEVPYQALPLVKEERYKATDIGKMCGLSNNMIGRIANKLRLKSPKYAQKRMSVSPYSNVEVVVYYYNEEAKDMILDYVKENITL